MGKEVIIVGVFVVIASIVLAGLALTSTPHASIPSNDYNSVITTSKLTTVSTSTLTSTSTTTIPSTTTASSSTSSSTSSTSTSSTTTTIPPSAWVNFTGNSNVFQIRFQNTQINYTIQTGENVELPLGTYFITAINSSTNVVFVNWIESGGVDIVNLNQSYTQMTLNSNGTINISACYGNACQQG